MRRPYPVAALLITLAALNIQAAEPPTQVPAAGSTQRPQSSSAQAPATPAVRKKTNDKATYRGPSDTDIGLAYQRRIDAINAGTKQYLDAAAAAQLTIRLVKIDIVACESFEDSTDLYVCNILVEAGVGQGEVEFKRAEIAMVKEQDAWRVQ